MVEMEQQMWREGDLFRARLKEEQSESSCVDGVSNRMGKLALAAAPDSKRSKRVGVSSGAKASSSKNSHASTTEVGEEVAFGLEGKEGGTTQGDLLRASRTKNARGPSPSSGLAPGPSSWDRSDGRLTRK